MNSHDFYASLMRHDVPRSSGRRSRARPLRLTPPRCDTCRKQPPACECKEQQ